MAGTPKAGRVGVQVRILGVSFGQVVPDADRRSPERDADAEPLPDTLQTARSRRSLLLCLPAVVLFAIVVADAMRSADTDLWGHIHFGNIVLREHQLFFHAPSSYACPT